MLIPLTDKSGKTMWVNAFQVRDIKPRKDGCDVRYGTAHSVRTDESAETVATRLNEAMLAANPAALAALISQPFTDDDNGAAALGAVL